MITECGVSLSLSKYFSHKEQLPYHIKASSGKHYRKKKINKFKQRGTVGHFSSEFKQCPFV